MLDKSRQGPGDLGPMAVPFGSELVLSPVAVDRVAGDPGLDAVPGSGPDAHRFQIEVERRFRGAFGPFPGTNLSLPPRRGDDRLRHGELQGKPLTSPAKVPKLKVRNASVQSWLSFWIQASAANGGPFHVRGM